MALTILRRGLSESKGEPPWLPKTRLLKDSVLEAIWSDMTCALRIEITCGERST